MKAVKAKCKQMQTDKTPLKSVAYIFTNPFVYRRIRSAQWSRYAKYPFLRQHDAGWENRFLDNYLAGN